MTVVWILVDIIPRASRNRPIGSTRCGCVRSWRSPKPNCPGTSRCCVTETAAGHVRQVTTTSASATAWGGQDRGDAALVSGRRYRDGDGVPVVHREPAARPEELSGLIGSSPTWSRRSARRPTSGACARWAIWSCSARNRPAGCGRRSSPPTATAVAFTSTSPWPTAAARRSSTRSAPCCPKSWPTARRPSSSWKPLPPKASRRTSTRRASPIPIWSSGPRGAAAVRIPVVAERVFGDVVHRGVLARLPPGRLPACAA